MGTHLIMLRLRSDAYLVDEERREVVLQAHRSVPEDYKKS